MTLKTEPFGELSPRAYLFIYLFIYYSTSITLLISYLEGCRGHNLEPDLLRSTSSPHKKQRSPIDCPWEKISVVY